MLSDLNIWVFVSYAVGTVVGLFIGRQWGIKIGSALTFDLLVRLGYVDYSINEHGEVDLRKLNHRRTDPTDD